MNDLESLSLDSSELIIIYLISPDNLKLLVSCKKPPSQRVGIISKGMQSNFVCQNIPMVGQLPLKVGCLPCALGKRPSIPRIIIKNRIVYQEL